MNVIVEIKRHNAGREPERLAMKFAKMKQSPFVFLRGACHLFYDCLPQAYVLHDAPLAWCCGDLHFENFGSYKADNRLVYFDMNDFDEAALAPCTWDLVRLLTSIRCGADALNTTDAESMALMRDCLSSYRIALRRGKSLWVEAETSSGLIHDLFLTLQERSRKEFLDRRTTKMNGLRVLKLDGNKALPLEQSEQQRIRKIVDSYASNQPNPGFFKVLDVARRIAGTGSLGVMRYIALVEGKGSSDGNYLLDIKEAKPSALIPALQRLGIAQVKWQNEAERVVTVQKRMQAVDHAFLSTLMIDGAPFVLKGLQPSEDRVAMGDWGKKLERLRDAVSTMGRILAWDQLRSSGRGGSANADELVRFSEREDWIDKLIKVAEEMTDVTRHQWEKFCKADI